MQVPNSGSGEQFIDPRLKATELRRKDMADKLQDQFRGQIPEPSPMNEIKSCEKGSVPPYPGVYSDGKGHSISVTYSDTRSGAGRAIVTAIPTAPLSQCAYLHADNDPDFRCSFRPVDGSQYCSFHRTAVAGDIVREKAEAYDRVKKLVSNSTSNLTVIHVARQLLSQLLDLTLRNQPDIKEN